MSNVTAWQAYQLEAFADVLYQAPILHLSCIRAVSVAVATCSFLNALDSLNSHVAVMQNVCVLIKVVPTSFLIPQDESISTVLFLQTFPLRAREAPKPGSGKVFNENV